jgi:hypothetical protein
MLGKNNLYQPAIKNKGLRGAYPEIDGTFLVNIHHI